jgi:hypothetical protein
LVDLQLDAQNSYLCTYNTFIKILYNYPAHLQEIYVVTVYMQPLVSSLSAGLVHRLTGAQDSHLQRVTIPEAAYINYDVDLLKKSREMLETFRGF